MPAENSLILVVTFWSAAFMPTMILSASEPEAKLPVKHSLSEREFRNQYASAVKKFKSGYQNVECHFDCSYKEYKFQAHLLAKEDSVVGIMNYAKATPLQGQYCSKIFCITPNYVFNLDKTKPGAPYLLSSIRHDKKQIVRARAITARDLDIYLFAASSMFEVSVETMLEMPSFKIEKIERYAPTEDEAEEVVSLDFTMNDDTWILTKGHLVFAPYLNWAVLEYNCRYNFSNNNYVIYSGINNFTPLQKNGVPILNYGEHKEIHYEDGKILSPTYKYSANLINFSLGNLDDSDFLLSNYGLPDAPLAVPLPATNNLMKWFLIGNGILLALIVIYVMIQRFRTVQTPENLS
ncbi:hypothetical protein [Gimesia sp.]|uniref:hypothetical protein n=1 Tax=Gimesia sp. TaxID=2024833 RepID=UPI000C491172|nr:hypothetical protein [Gimesia sp.]MAX38438.1 hypothetical protein [Gimesia sp.]HBL44690.1 hypothetical protein [Planctomycetaceae bacterium]